MPLVASLRLLHFLAKPWHWAHDFHAAWHTTFEHLQWWRLHHRAALHYTCLLALIIFCVRWPVQDFSSDLLLEKLVALKKGDFRVRHFGAIFRIPNLLMQNLKGECDQSSSKINPNHQGTETPKI